MIFTSGGFMPNAAAIFDKVSWANVSNADWDSQISTNCIPPGTAHAAWARQPSGSLPPIIAFAWSYCCWVNPLESIRTTMATGAHLLCFLEQRARAAPSQQLPSFTELF